MDRRSFLLGATSFALAGSNRQADAAPSFIGATRRAFVEHPQLVQQQCVKWCWAASCSMIFGTLGHPTDQKKLVDYFYDELDCAPAQKTGMLTRILDNAWIDDRGQLFRPRFEVVYDQENGVNAMDDSVVVAELRQKRPLLYANTHHCMVIVEADYVVTPMGPKIVNLGVLDPMPPSVPPFTPPFHPLTRAELRPEAAGGEMVYLAAVRI